MSKSLVGAFGALGTASVAAPVTFLSSSGGSATISDTKKIINNKFQEPTLTGRKIPKFEKSSDIKSKLSEINCLKEKFTTTIHWNTNPRTENPVVNFSSATNNNLSGCLVIEHYKQTYNGDKWWGGFKLVLSLTNGNDGLITSFNVDVKGGKVISDSSIYIINKNVGDSNPWYLYFKQEETIKEITDFSNQFPKKGTAITSEASQDYWDFYSGDQSKICGMSECTENPKDTSPTLKSLEWKFTGSSSGNQTATSWSGNFDTWFDNSFGNAWSGVKSTLNTLKGTWAVQN